jgi:hypothetical protein
LVLNGRRQQLPVAIQTVNTSGTTSADHIFGGVAELKFTVNKRFQRIIGSELGSVGTIRRGAVTLSISALLNIAANISASLNHQPSDQHSDWAEQQSAPKRRKNHGQPNCAASWVNENFVVNVQVKYRAIATPTAAGTLVFARIQTIRHTA